MMENVKKLELGIRKAAFGDGVSEISSRQERQMIIDEGMDLEEEALMSGDDDVLDRAFEYFLEESVDNGLGNGVCETMEGEIWQYFTPEQILIVFEKKYRQLVEQNMSRACNTAIALVNTGYFNEFRRIFNQQKVKNSEILVADLEKFVDDEFKKEISLLREDMKKW